MEKLTQMDDVSFLEVYLSLHVPLISRVGSFLWAWDERTEIRDMDNPPKIAPGGWYNRVHQERVDEVLSTAVPVSELDPEDLECAICKENYEHENSGPHSPVRLPCGHVMGKSCLLEWLSGAQATSCPLDRTELMAAPLPCSRSHVRFIHHLGELEQNCKKLEETYSKLNEFEQFGGMFETWSATSAVYWGSKMLSFLGSFRVLSWTLTTESLKTAQLLALGLGTNIPTENLPQPLCDALPVPQVDDVDNIEQAIHQYSGAFSAYDICSPKLEFWDATRFSKEIRENLPPISFNRWLKEFGLVISMASYDAEDDTPSERVTLRRLLTIRVSLVLEGFARYKKHRMARAPLKGLDAFTWMLLNHLDEYLNQEWPATTIRLSSAERDNFLF